MSKSEYHRERWWLSSGEEECPHCGQLFAYEVEFRCTDCDGPLCPHCIVRYEDRHVCPECVDVPSEHAAREGG